MSIHLNWIAAKRADVRPWLAALGLREVAAVDDEHAKGWAYTVSPAGWLVLASSGMKLELDKRLPALAAEGTVLAGEVSEIAMASELQAWGDGRRLWSVTRDTDRREDPLATEGEPPKALAEIEQRLAARQAAETENVDHMFDGPLELGERICGYRPDRALPGPWIRLAPIADRREPVVSALPEAIGAELLPMLVERGWTLAPVRLSANGREYAATRLRNGQLQCLRYLWRDDRQRLEVVPSFAILESDRRDARVLVAGGISRDPPTAFERLKAWGAGLGRPTKRYDVLVAEAIERARADLPNNDRFIAEDAAGLSHLDRG